MEQPPGLYRVCLVVGQLTRGGLERQAYLLASNLDRQRLDATVVSLSKGGAWADELIRADVKVRMLERHGGWDLRRLRRLVRLFRDIKPDLVYSFNYETNAYARIAGLLAGVPILVTGERGIYLEGTQILLERILHRFTECVVANAEAIRKDLVERVGLRAAKVITVRNAVLVPPAARPADRVAARSALEVRADSDIVVGTIARLDEVKNLGLLLRAAELGRSSGLPLAFRIVGGGPEEVRLRNEIRNGALEDVVALLGERPDASALLAGFDVFVLTSRSEGLPNTVMEAMAAGLPCVCTDVGGCRELVQHGVTGYLVSPGDARALSARILELAGDRRTRARFGEAGRRRIENEFSVERLVTCTEGLLLTLLAAKDSRMRGHRLTEGALNMGR